MRSRAGCCAGIRSHTSRVRRRLSCAAMRRHRSGGRRCRRKYRYLLARLRKTPCFVQLPHLGSRTTSLAADDVVHRYTPMEHRLAQALRAFQMYASWIRHGSIERCPLQKHQWVATDAVGNFKSAHGDSPEVGPDPALRKLNVNWVAAANLRRRVDGVGSASQGRSARTWLRCIPNPFASGKWRMH